MPTPGRCFYRSHIFLFQLATREVPFQEFDDVDIYPLLSKGKRPQKPYPFEAPGFTPDVWRIAEMCWHQKPKKRPAVHTVLRRLEDIANGGECTCTSARNPCVTFIWLLKHRQGVSRRGLYDSEDLPSCANCVWVGGERRGD